MNYMARITASLLDGFRRSGERHYRDMTLLFYLNLRFDKGEPHKLTVDANVFKMITAIPDKENK